MKTRWERYCELRSMDNWILANPQKANLIGLVGGALIFGLSLLLRAINPIILFFLVFAGYAWLLLSQIESE